MTIQKSQTRITMDAIIKAADQIVINNNANGGSQLITNIGLVMDAITSSKIYIAGVAPVDYKKEVAMVQSIIALYKGMATVGQLNQNNLDEYIIANADLIALQNKL